MSREDFNWSTEFFKPLMLGGQCWVGTPLGQELRPTAQRLPYEAVFEEILPQMLADYAEWLPSQIQPFDETFGLLVASMYEMAATVHPQMDAFFAQAHDFSAHAHMQLEKCPHAKTPSDFVTRHLAVAPLLRLKRQKVEVKWWGGQATFLGQTPNARLLLWPKVRRVQTEEKQEVFWTALLNQGDESNRAQRRKLLKAMFIKSPLTLMVAASSQLAFEDLELNPLVSVPDPVSSESQWSPFLLWEDATLSRGVIDYWLGHEPLVAARTLTFWLLQSLNEKTASALAQKRCLEVLMYLLWSTLIIDRPQDEVKQIWTHDFWVKSPAHWPEGRLERWALIAWALEETDLAQPFYDLDPYGREIFQKLMKRLVHSEIQLRKQAMENQLAAIWTSQAP